MKKLENPRAAVRRLSFVVSESAYNELQDLADQSRRSMTELVRYGIGLMKVADEAKRKKLRLMVVDEDNKAIREIVIPS
jgi:hypothetical protein